MTANGNGQWSKKFQGRVYYFGAWDEWREAEKDYARRWPSIVAGHGDPKEVDRVSAAGIVDADFDTLAGLYLGVKLKQRNERRISRPHYDGIARELAFLLDYRGEKDRGIWRHSKVASKKPADWALFNAKLEDHYGPDGRKRMVVLYRSLSRFGASNGYAPAFSFGESLPVPGKGEIRQARRQMEKDRGPKIFPRPQIPHILQECGTQHMRAMVLLGLNCGFTAADCGALRADALDLTNGVFDYDRVKTGIQRAGYLWPETVEALVKAIAGRPDVDADAWKSAMDEWKATEPKDGKEAIKRWRQSEPRWDKLVFITRFGLPWVRQNVKVKDGRETTIRQDAIGLEFTKILEACDANIPRGVGGWPFKRQGISFGVLRHTFYTNAKLIDAEAAQYIQGHSESGMGEWYDHLSPAKWQQLAYVAEGVYSALMMPPANDGTLTIAGASGLPRLRLPGFTSGTAASSAAAV